MMPSGNGPFPNKKKKKKKMGEGADQQRHLFHWKPSVGRVKESQDCLCFRHFLLDPESGRRGGGQWLEASLVVPFLFHTQSNTHLKHAAAISQNLSQPLAFSCVWGSFVAGLDCISRTGGIKWHCERLWAQKFSCSGTTHPFPVHRTRRSL